VLEFEDASPAWDLTVPTDARKVTFVAVWGHWDGNGGGSSTCWFRANVAGCDTKIDLSRGGTGHAYDCDVAAYQGQTITFDYCQSSGTCCSYIHMADVKWHF
jgi:hypothetical protein